jgi:putative FmdB family regulatory protein
MPLYEYQCESCDGRFERIQKFADPPVAECPACGGPVRKLVSSPAFQFKGSGWYVTDYARKAERAPSDGSDKGPAGKDQPVEKPTAGEATSSKDSGGSDAKPAAAAATPGKPESKPG